MRYLGTPGGGIGTRFLLPKIGDSPKDQIVHYHRADEGICGWRGSPQKKKNEEREKKKPLARGWVVLFPSKEEL